MSVKGPWCNWSRLNGPLKHGKGGVTRCSAMMSSIGALCGSQACHSFIPPGVCCWSHPSTKAIAKTWLVGPCTQTWKSTPPPSPPASSSHGYATVTPNTLAQHSFSFSPIPCGRHTPLEKSPYHSLHQHGTQSPPTHLLLQGETFPSRGEKHLVVISFSFFFTLLFPLAPFHS